MSLDLPARVQLSCPKSEVLAANEAFHDAFNRRNVAAMDVLWSRAHPVACIHPRRNVLRSREEIMASWEAILSNADQPRVVAGGAQAVLLGDTAVVVCRELVAGAPLVATNVFAREDDRWRLIHHHSGPVAMVET